MTKSKQTKRELPPDVTEADLTHDYTQALPWGSFPEGTTSYLTFYQVGGNAARSALRGWVLCTLNLGGKGRAGQAERTYGIEVATEKVCRVGRGPHVLQTVTVYLSKANIARLQKYVDLHQKGLADAGQIRDRISTRRAQGQIHRANGRTHWSW